MPMIPRPHAPPLTPSSGPLRLIPSIFVMHSEKHSHSSVVLASFFLPISVPSDTAVPSHILRLTPSRNHSGIICATSVTTRDAGDTFCISTGMCTCLCAPGRRGLLRTATQATGMVLAPRSCYAGMICTSIHMRVTAASTSVVTAGATSSTGVPARSDAALWMWMGIRSHCLSMKRPCTAPGGGWMRCGL